MRIECASNAHSMSSVDRPLIIKYGVSIRAHVTEGICIPFVAKPDLIRNVTIRGCGCGRST